MYVTTVGPSLRTNQRDGINVAADALFEIISGVMKMLKK